MENESAPTIDPDTMAEVEAILGARVAEDPEFAAAVIADPTAVLARLLAEVTGADPDLDGVTVVLDPAAAAALGELHDAEVAGYTSPIPYPSINGIPSSGGWTCTIHQGGGGGEPGTGGAGLTSLSSSINKAQFVVSYSKVKVEGTGIVGFGH
jgi:hypothetical protein